ncbi:uncharacterized protein LOC122650788 [Telopea speciosissima]|uniref:uncharacterized protein LOC122650788 n=1 Tax=Telopea speciosissima TaxID=54955 RepID=UPI001CC5E2A1|nr:uncharacterized protein LOC122650788 [Telopea speciosissima]
MAKRQATEVVNRKLQDIIENSNSFGGKIMVFGGDFRQVLSVVPRATRTEMVDARVGNSEELTESECLIRIPDEMLIQYKDLVEGEKELIKTIFPSLHGKAHLIEYIKERAILASKNETVDKLNEKLIDQFPGDSVTYYSFDSTTDDTQTNYPEEFLNSLVPNGLPPHKLVLKKNCLIMLLRNLDPSQGECNGTRLVCREFKKNVILAEIAAGQFSGNLVPLPRIPLCPAENEGYPFHLKR